MQPDRHIHASTRETHVGDTSLRDACFLEPTDYCDFRDSQIEAVASRIENTARDPVDYAVRCFYWARDEIKYTVGLDSHTASETLKKGHGSCTNKANLFVALMRARGIPSGFHVMRVDSRHYFGPICPPEVMRFMGSNSVHIYSAVRIGRWLKCDNTDDLALSLGACHINPPARPVEFDGKQDARLHIDPAHVHEDNGERLDSVDALLEKTPRINPIVPAVFNAFGDFVRAEGRRIHTVEMFQAGFFPWLMGRNPTLWRRFQEFTQVCATAREEGHTPILDSASNIQRDE